MKPATLELPIAGTNALAIIEDDGATVYAYLWDRRDILAKVWLSNRSQRAPSGFWKRLFGGAAGTAPVSKDGKEECPDLNRAKVEIKVIDEAALKIEIYLNGVLWARLWRGAHPGKSRNAHGMDSLAKPLSPEGAS